MIDQKLIIMLEAFNGKGCSGLRIGYPQPGAQ